MPDAWATLEPAARLIAAMLFNGLWQGALIALAVWAILHIFPHANASTRYAAWSAALLAVLVVPLLTTLPRVSAEYVASTANAPVQSRLVSSKPLDRLPVATGHIFAPVAAPWTPPHLAVPAWLAVALFAIWALVALASFVRLILSLVQLERLKADSLPLGVEYRDVMARWTGAAKGARDVRLCVSNEIEVPVAIGLFDAMILLPKHLLDRLESHEIDQIALHELAHLRRADDWTNGLQRIAQALLFFNPAVAFIAHQMDLEREVACDDWVLASTGDARPYAFCLTKMAEVTAWPHRALAAPGAFVTRKNISIRIERLLAAKRAIGSTLLPGPSSAVLGALIAAFFVLRTVTPSIAYTSQPAPEPEVATTATVVAAVAEPIPKNSPHHSSSAAPAPTERPPSVIPGGPRKVAKVATPSVVRLAPIAGVPADVSRLVDMSSQLANTIVAQALTARAPSPEKLGAFSCLGCDMHGISWPGRDLHGATMTGADFHGADLHGANLSKAHLTGIDLRGANLTDASFAGADMQGCDLKGARIQGADFAGASMTGCSIDPSALSPAQAVVLLRACIGCDFQGANLRDRDLRGIHLTGVDLSGADLRGADLSHAAFSGVDFERAKFDGAKLEGTSFAGCDLGRVDLRNVDLSHASLTGSSFSNAIMR